MTYHAASTRAPDDEIARPEVLVVLPEAKRPAIHAPTRTPDTSWAQLLAASAASRYLYDLPVIYHDSPDGFLGRYLKIFETIWEPFEWRQNQIASYFDPRTCPVELLGRLEHWLGLTIGAYWPEAQRRLLLAEAHRLYRLRGTEWALAHAIEIYTGTLPTIEQRAQEPFVVSINLRLGDDSECERAVVEALIEFFKPAHIGYHLRWSDSRE